MGYSIITVHTSKLNSMELAYTIGYYTAIVAMCFVVFFLLPRYLYMRFKSDSLRDAFQYEVFVLICFLWITCLPILILILKPLATWQF